MKGFELKEFLTSKGVILSELAVKLGMSPQGLKHRFEVKNVKPEFIKQIEDVVDFKIEDIKPVSTETQQFIELLKKKDEQIDRLLTLLEKRDGIVYGKEKKDVPYNSLGMTNNNNYAKFKGNSEENFQ